MMYAFPHLLQIPICTPYAYSKLPIQKDDSDSFSHNKSTDPKTESDNHNEERSKTQRLIELIRKGVNKLGNFMLNCICTQPSSDEYIIPDPYYIYVLEGLAYC